ncbi:hypothetical protein [Oligoflexus tunisiensis]|uniref:hypothetical protein n=1 Tax=Oligoflexus tunisiensis TaxID=708132 RepID=UPI00114C931E|nr:hypothetical protein [Oligoflexus tunisiensis]
MKNGKKISAGDEGFNGKLSNTSFVVSASDVTQAMDFFAASEAKQSFTLLEAVTFQWEGHSRARSAPHHRNTEY